MPSPGRNCTVPEPVEGTHRSHLTSLRRAQRPYGRAGETESRPEGTATRILVAAALGPRGATDAGNGAARSLSLSYGRSSRHAASTSSATVWPSRATVSRLEEPATRIFIAAALCPRGATDAGNGTVRSLSLPKRHDSARATSLRQAQRPYGRAIKTTPRSELPPKSPSLLDLVHESKPTGTTEVLGP